MRRSETGAVLQLCSYIRANAFHARLFDAIAAQGVEQQVFSPLKIMDSRARPVDGVRVHEGSRRKWSWTNKLVYSSKMRHYRRWIDDSTDLGTARLVHAHSIYADGIVAHRIAAERKLPLVLTVRGGDVTLFPKYYPHWRSKARAAVEAADTTVFVNPNYPPLLERVLGCSLDPSRVAIVPNGVDALWFEGEPNPAPDGPPWRIVCTGKLIPRKNQLGLIAAVELARERGLDLRLDLIGASVGRYGQEVEDRVAALDWADYLGEKSAAEIQHLYSHYHLFALPSHEENFGLVYAEALLSDLPVLYTRNEGFDGWSERVYGVGVNSREPRSIADGLIALLENRASAAEGKSIVRRLFHWRDVASRHIALYDRLSARPFAAPRPGVAPRAIRRTGSDSNTDRVAQVSGLRARHHDREDDTCLRSPAVRH